MNELGMANSPWIPSDRWSYVLLPAVIASITGLVFVLGSEPMSTQAYTGAALIAVAIAVFVAYGWRTWQLEERRVALRQALRSGRKS